MSSIMNLGRVAIINKGEYEDGIPYTPLDVVTFSGSSYMNTSACMGIPPTDKAYWTPVAKRGAEYVPAYYKGKHAPTTLPDGENMPAGWSLSAQEPDIDAGEQIWMSWARLDADGGYGAWSNAYPVTGKNGSTSWAEMTELEKQGILSRIELNLLGFTNSGAFVVADEDGNIVIRYDAAGFDVASLSPHFQSLIRQIEGMGLKLGTTAGTAFDGAAGAALAAKFNQLSFQLKGLDVFIPVAEDGLYVTDSEGNICWGIGADGIIGSVPEDNNMSYTVIGEI